MNTSAAFIIAALTFWGAGWAGPAIVALLFAGLTLDWSR